MTNRILCIAALALIIGLQACTKTKNVTETANSAAEEVANSTEAITPEQPTTTLSWDKEEHDFGNIMEGDKVLTKFEFTNTGNEPMIISSAKGACGCTVPQWPKEPIAPGEKGTIDVEFNSKNKPGQQTKMVTIQANTNPNPMRIKIKAQVEKDPNKKENTAAQPKAVPVPQPSTQNN